MKTKSFSKRIVSVVIAMIMLMAMVPSVSVLAREYAADVSINGITVQFENAPYSKNDIIYIPLEEIGGYLNLNITKEGNVFNLVRMGQTLKVESGNLVAFLDGKEVMLSTNPEMKNGVTYVPVDLFSAGFGCPVTIAEDKRSADIVPNVYRVSVTENMAAAVSAASPDKDLLGTGTSSVDTIFNNAAVFPKLEKSLFYMFDLSAFSGLKIEKALLSINIDKSEYSPTLRIERTAPWKKGEVTYNTQPVSYESEYVTGGVAESNYVDKQYNIVSLVNAAQAAGETLAIKLMGIPHSSKKNSDNNSFTIRGVNTTKAPYLEIYVQENYIFPVKSGADAQEENANKYSELALLKSLGVFTEEDEFPLDLSEGVQRQEFVRYALRLRNASLQEGDGEQFFSDVPADAPFYKDIMTAHSMGLVAGWQGIAFRPYDRITMGEAITILGRMLNYNIFADERGGFTPGYFAAARQGDLYNGAQLEQEVLSFRKMFTLFEDALQAKMLNVYSYSSIGTAEYIFDESKTILSEYWNAKEIKGVVTANEYSSLVPETDGKEGTIVIDRKELKINFEPYNEFLGYRVRGWYNLEDELLYLGILESDITEVDLIDIVGTGETASTVSFTYKKDNRNYVSETFSKANVIYNGKSIASGKVSAALLDADGGSVKLIGDSLAVINAYKTVTVYSVDEDEEVIYDKYDSYNNAVELKGKEYIIRDIYGKNVEISSLNTDDILSVAISLDGELINAILSTVKITGSISAAENLGTDDEILIINGSEYRTRNHLRNETDSIDEYWWDYIDLAANGTFLIDAFGSIVGFNPTRTNGVKGYFLTMGTKGSALSKDLQMAVMVEGSEKYVVYDLADKVKIDGKSYKVSSDTAKIKAKFQDEAYGQKVGDYVTQGIIFDLNADGMIKEIDTAKSEEGENEETTLQIRRKISDGTLRYKNSGSLGGKYYVKLSNGLGVFCYEEGNFDEYEAKTSGLANDGLYSFDLYTIGTRTPEAAIVYRRASSSDSSVGDDPSLMLVDRIVTMIDEDYCEVKKLYYYNGTSRSSVVIPDEMVSKLKKKTLSKPVASDYTGGTNSEQYKADLEAYNADPGNAAVYNEITRGDIIRMETDDRGEVTAIQECYDITDKIIFNNDIASFNALNRTYGGYTGMVEGSYIKITKTADISDSGTYAWIDSSRFSGFYSYEATSAGVEVTPVTLSDVRTVENVPYNPTGIILQSAYENLRKNVWMIELDQPEGTGKFSLSYSSGTTDSVSGVKAESVRCANDGSVTVETTKPTRTGYAFKYWLNEANGQKYAPGATFTLTANVTLTAQWAETPTHVITLKDTETGTEASFDFSPMAWDDVNEELIETKFEIPDEAAAKAYGFAKDGWKHIGWEGYSIGQEISVTGNITLEAKMIQCWSGTASATELTPNSDGYYEITSGEELAWFASKVNAGNTTYKAKLMNDIYLNNFADCGDGKSINETSANWFENVDVTDTAKVNSWNSFMMKSFAGEFDGNEKTIYGLYMQGGEGTGFFSSVTGGTVKNVTFEGAYVVSTSTSTKDVHNISIVCSNATTSATFSGISVSGKAIPADGKYLNTFGAIAGKVGAVSISNCTSNVMVDGRVGGTTTAGSGNYGVGGIVGTTTITDGAQITITGCTNNGKIIMPYNWKVSGILGNVLNASGITFTDCKNTATIRYASGSRRTDYPQIYGHRNNGKTATVTNPTENGTASVYNDTEVID